MVCAAERGAKLFAKKYQSDPNFVKSRNSKISAWKKSNRSTINLAAAKWREANRDKIRDYNKRWRTKNPEKARDNHKKNRAKNPEKYRQYVRDWATRNPERAVHVRRASKINRRAREVANGGRSTGCDIEKLFKLQKGRCAECRKRRKLQIDHIMAIANGGTSNPSNLQLLCGPCNKSKSDKDTIVWAQEKGRLL